ncbi:MAG: OmpW family outer membrane protein [Sphingomonas sp.]
MRFTFSLPLIAVAALSATPASAQSTAGARAAGDWLVRLRAILVSPTERSGEVTGIAASKVGVNDSVMPEVDFTYLFTDHIGAELILATTKHDVTGRGAIAPLGKIADSWVLPPTLTLQYHFAPGGKIHPYVGAGVNYTIFYSSDSTKSLDAALGATKVRIGDSFGYALQAGVDLDIGRRLFLNADVKYIDMDTTARLTSGTAKRSVRVNVDPVVAAVGIGVRF